MKKRTDIYLIPFYSFVKKKSHQIDAIFKKFRLHLVSSTKDSNHNEQDSHEEVDEIDVKIER